MGIKISKIIGCGLERIGELLYDFYLDACGTFHFLDSEEERVMLCQSSADTCRRVRGLGIACFRVRRALYRAFQQERVINVTGELI